jgi:hypothetical protein
MRTAIPLAPLACLAAAAFALTARIGAQWEERLVVYPVAGMAVRSQSSGDGGLRGLNGDQTLKQTPTSYVAEYAFKNFNSDPLKVHFEVAKDDFDSHEGQWGYKDSDIADLKAWHEKARKTAFNEAVAQGKSQPQLNAALADLKALYEKKRADYLQSRCFTLEEGGVVDVDMPQLVRTHSGRVATLAREFDKIARDKRYDSSSVIGSVTAMVQTAVEYKVPPNVVNGVHTGGLWPPVKTLVGGWGDCDTKTGLLASILANWPAIKMIGVSLPDHYLMAILRIPQKGELFVEYRGLQYVLVEPAGPAWLTPGSVGDETQHLLDAPQGPRIEAFF